jgi:hypothetical protein
MILRKLFLTSSQNQRVLLPHHTHMSSQSKSEMFNIQFSYNSRGWMSTVFWSQMVMTCYNIPCAYKVTSNSPIRVTSVGFCLLVTLATWAINCGTQFHGAQDTVRILQSTQSRMALGRCSAQKLFIVISYSDISTSCTQLHILTLCLVARPPMWSSDQNSWLQIKRFGFDSRRYQIFWQAVDLERGPLSLMSTI